jgi:hypothetical protein
MSVTFKWEPAPALLDKLTTLAHHRGLSLETLVTEAVARYLETEPAEPPANLASDPLVGLFAGPPDLATRAEEILEKEITLRSGWTWKETLL